MWMRWDPENGRLAGSVFTYVCQQYTPKLRICPHTCAHRGTSRALSVCISCVSRVYLLRSDSWPDIRKPSRTLEHHMREADPASYLKPVLQPLLRWMAETNTLNLLIRASPHGQTAVLDRPQDESDALCHSDEAPDAPGLLGIYTVVDPASGGRHDGPPTVPMVILGPVLSELDSHDIDELRIATGPEVSPTPEVSGPAANDAPSFRADEFTEDVVPEATAMPAFVELPSYVHPTLSGHDDC